MIERGISMRDLKRLWEDHGGTVENVRRTGEVRFTHPQLQQRSSVANNRRKDAPMKLIVFVRRALERQLQP